MPDAVENTTVPASEQFHVYVPFDKVEENDDGTLTVYGRATEETPDYQGEIMDYESSVPLWKQRTKEFYDISGGNALLPLRAMHQPIAAGKVVGVEYKPEEKAIDIVAHVVDANEVNKVRKHVYNGFSVGGKYSKRNRDLRNPSLVRYTGDPREVSIVDKPAVPTAKFTLFKIEDPADLQEEAGEEVHKGWVTMNGHHVYIPDGGDAGAGPGNVGNVNDPAHQARVEAERNRSFSHDHVELKAGDQVTWHTPMEPGEADQKLVIREARGDRVLVSDIKDVQYGQSHQGYIVPTQAVRAGELVHIGRGKDDAGTPIEQPDWVEQFHKDVETLSGLRKAEAADKDAAEGKLRGIGSRVGIKRRDGEPLTPPKDYPEDPDEYGDPANFNYPVDEKRHQAAVSRFNGGQGKEQYSPRERHVLGRRIARLASRFGNKYQYNPDKMQVERKDAKKMSDTNGNMSKLDIGGLLAQLKAARDMAADAISKDPAAAKDAMNALMGNLDSVLTDASRPVGAAPEAPVSDPDTTITGATISKAAAPSSSPSSVTPAGTTTVTPPVAKAVGAKEVGATSTASSPSTVGAATTLSQAKAAKPADSDETDDSPSDKPGAKTDDTDAYKALSAKVDALAEGLGKLATALSKSPALAKAAASAESPLQALNSVVEKVDEKPEWTEDPIIKALMEGGPYSYVKALKAAGVDGIDGALAPQRISEAIRKATYEDLEATGVITKSRYVGKLYTPGEGGR